MALLQISEPGQSAAPHQHRLAAGIDLGTTNSLSATVQSAVARALPDEDGALLRPSVVRFTLTAVSVAETKVASSLRPSVAVHSRACNGMMPAIKSAATPRENVFMLGGEFDQKGREGTSGKWAAG